MERYFTSTKAWGVACIYSSKGKVTKQIKGHQVLVVSHA